MQRRKVLAVHIQIPEIIDGQSKFTHSFEKGYEVWEEQHGIVVVTPKGEQHVFTYNNVKRYQLENLVKQKPPEPKQATDSKAA